MDRSRGARRVPLNSFGLIGQGFKPMIDLKKLQAAANKATTSKTASIKTVTASVQDGILTIQADLRGGAPNSSGRSIPVATFSGLRVDGEASFKTPDGQHVAVPGLVLHVHGGVSVYHRDPGVRAALGLTAKGGDQ